MVRSPRRRRDGFTLIELLIVITIIAILASMGFGAYNRAIEAANRARCVANLRAVGTAIANYRSDHGSNYPIGQKNGKTVFYTIKDQADIGGQQGTAAPAFLCPSRHSASALQPGTNPSDYGWSSDPRSILGRSTPTANVNDGADNTLLIGHIGIVPTDYPTGPSQNKWDTAASFLAVGNGSTLQRDQDLSSSGSSMGAPHTSVPFLFASCGRVSTVDYDSDTSQLQKAWWSDRKTSEALSQNIGN